MQPDQLLSAKLNIPFERRDYLVRPRLTERLSAGLQRKVTLCSAPTGFGKTSLVSEWIRVSGVPAAWLSLDANDNDPVRFLSYLIASLQTVRPLIGQDILTWLQAPPQFTAHPAPLSTGWTDRVLTILVNQIAHTPGPVILVLDDYHLIEATLIHASISFLIDHSPAHLHVVLACRADPPLPIARWRARRQVNELRAPELRCTADETLTLLNQVMRLGLSREDVSALESRTEGWIAGLQLAAMALQPLVPTTMHPARTDQTIAHQFVKDFSGSHRYVLDYLMDEVLSHQTQDMQQFLLQTAILDQLNGELCDAVTGRQDSQTILENIERLNLFLVSLDGERHWYRYYSLFADLLRHRLETSLPDQLPVLHRRASEWNARHGRLFEAVGHALAAKDFTHAASLIESAGPTMAMRGEAATLLAWMDALPDHAVQARPRLSLTYAWALFVTSNIESIEPRLQDALRRLDVGLAVEGILEEVAILRAFIAVYQGAGQRAIDLCLPVLRQTPEHSLARCGVHSVLGDAYFQIDQLDHARRQYEQAVQCATAAGNPLLSQVMVNDLAHLKITQARLREAAQHFRAVLDWGANERAPLFPVGEAYVGLGELLREWNEFPAATSHLRTGIAYCERGGYTRYAMLGTLSLARIVAARGDHTNLRALIERAEQLARGSGIPSFQRLVAATRARLSIQPAAFDSAVAFAWASASGLRAHDEPTAANEFDYLTWARVLLAKKSSVSESLATRQLLNRLLELAEHAGRAHSQIEILMLLALEAHSQNETDKPLNDLARALELAEPENYTRLFVDEGHAIAALLRLAIAKNIRPVYAAYLLNACDQPARDQPLALGESLTEREMQVLRLLAAGMSNADIAEHLVITLTTVKAHARNIFRKLDVDNRTQAAARARELNLL
jgi:LuxR family maltose regulon positive regulatory protein